jgi:hypothetical protein
MGHRQLNDKPNDLGFLSIAIMKGDAMMASTEIA